MGSSVVKMLAMRFPDTYGCWSCTELKTAHHKIEEADVVVSEDQVRACVIILCICSRCPICFVSVTRPVSLLANRMIGYSVITGYFGFFISKGQLPVS